MVRANRSSVVGLADLLWLAQASELGDAACLAVAARAMDWPFAPQPEQPSPPRPGGSDLDDGADPPPLPPPPPPPPPLAGASHKLPLRAPPLLTVEVHVGLEPLRQGPTIEGDWRQCDPAEVAIWFQQPAQAARPQLRQIDASLNLMHQLSVALARGQGSRRVDWAALCERFARLEALLPFPHLAHALPASHCVVLIDQSAHLRLWWAEWKALVLHWLRFRGETGLEVWRLPQGPAGPWVAVGSEVSRAPWSADTAVLILSDFGACAPDAAGRRASLQEDWCQWLQAYRDDAVPFVGLVPAGAPTSPKLSLLLTHLLTWGNHRPTQAVEPLVDRLLQALSVCPWFDADLLRACRAVLWPESGPAAEAHVWGSDHLAPTAWERDWKSSRRDQFSTALNDPLQWPVSQLMTLVDVHLRFCALAPPVHADVVALNLSACLALRGLRHSELEERASLARERQARLAGHLLSNASARRDGGATVAGNVAGFAHARGASLTSQARQHNRALASQWWALDAAFEVHAKRAAPKPVDVDDSVLRRLLERNSGGEVRSFELRQRGAELYLHQSPATGNAGALLKEGIELEGALLGLKWASKAEWQFLDLGSCDQQRGLMLGRLPEPAATGQQIEQVMRMQAAMARSATFFQYVQRPHWAAAFKGGRRDGAMGLIHWPDGEECWIRVSNHQGRLEERESRWVLHMDAFGPRLQWEEMVERALAEGSSPEAWDHLAFRYLPPATFLMGSPNGVGETGEHPQHPVTLSQGLWLAETPCTQALWQAVMGSNPSHFNKGPEAPQRPVECVSWDDVQLFLARLNKLLPQGCEAVLPTEAQWEYACRAGTLTTYNWGDEPEDSRATFDRRGDKDWDAEEGTTPVDCYPPNPWGLRDMHGNVWEWCSDGDLRAYESSATVDPMGEFGGDDRVVRGGSWIDPPDFACSAFRDRGHERGRRRDRGFRFALRSSAPQGAELQPGGLKKEKLELEGRAAAGRSASGMRKAARASNSKKPGLDA